MSSIVNALSWNSTKVATAIRIAGTASRRADGLGTTLFRHGRLSALVQLTEQVVLVTDRLVENRKGLDR